MKALLPILNILENGGKFTQSVNYACKLAGLPTGIVRPPLEPLKNFEKSQWSEIVRDFKAGIARI